MNAPEAVNVLAPTFWLWGIAIIFQTAVFAAVGTWAVSRFITRLISEIRTEIQKAVTELESADKTVAKETGDTIAAMRQHVSNLERDTEKRFHAAEKKALEDRAYYLEEFVRRGSFLHVTGKIEGAVEKLAADVKTQFEKMAEKIDEIRA